MKILFTLTGPWGTGAATVVEGVAQELLEQGHTVKMVFPDLGLPSPDKDRYYQAPDHYHIIRFPFVYRGVNFYTFPLIIPDPNPRNLEGAWTFKTMTAEQFSVYIEFLKQHLRGVLEEFRPDVIETEHVWLMGYVLHKLGCRYLVGAHNSDQMGFRYDARMRPYAKACAKGADRVFAISESVRQECLKLYRLNPEKVVVIPSGYNTAIFRPIHISKAAVFSRFEIAADPSLPVVTFSGKLSKTKGVDTLLSANGLLQATHPCLLFLFGSGNLEEALGRAPTKAEMRNVFLMGHATQDVLSQFHAIAEISVAPSREEGFCVSALEAMGCGVPVVGSDIPPLRELIVGALVSRENPQELAGGMARLLRLPAEHMKRLKKSALQKARQYTWKRNASARLKHYVQT
jgi:glycosyltransferase involved in cell wall biosynthesis